MSPSAHVRTILPLLLTAGGECGGGRVERSGVPFAPWLRDHGARATE